ncbi:MAG: hypothetical protein JXM79_22795 [Sedimentisphaerales bacterium]|nr:hypothetical protein [Sedimentisphaerales bacterium]
MSEKTFQDTQDQILKTAFIELERNKELLTGKKFRKFYRILGVILLCIPSIATSGFMMPPKMQSFFFLTIVIVTAVGGLTFVTWGIDNLNRRIDKIIELTGVETKLEEKYYSNIKITTELYPKKGNS